MLSQCRLYPVSTEFRATPSMTTNSSEGSFSIASLLSQDRAPRRKNPAPVRVNPEQTALEDNVQKQYNAEIHGLERRLGSVYRSSLSPRERVTPGVERAPSCRSTPDSTRSRSISDDERCNSVESNRSSGSIHNVGFHPRHRLDDKSPSRFSPLSPNRENLSPRSPNTLPHLSPNQHSTTSGLIPRLGPLNLPSHHFNPAVSSGVLPVPMHGGPASFAGRGSAMFANTAPSHTAMHGAGPAGPHLQHHHAAAAALMSPGNPFFNHSPDQVSQ